MTGGAPPSPRRADVRRWKRKILDELAHLPREHEALEFAMTEFGTDFDLTAVKAALLPDADIALYNRVQALERAITRVQNIHADLAVAGAKLARLPLPDVKAGDAERSFEALKEAKVIGNQLCKRLRRSQRARNMIEHDYENVSAGQLHDVAEEVRELSREFVRPFRAWVEPLL